MEILKKVITGIFLGMFTLSAHAQDYNRIIEAFQQSYLKEASGDYSKAVTEIKNVYDKDSYEINIRLGWLTYSAGLFTESIAYYNKAISLMPYSVEARFGLALPSSAMGNWSVVIAQYEKILEINPNNSVANHRLGLIYYGRDNFEKAEKYFEKVVNLYPFDYDGLIMLAWTKLKLNKLRESKILFYKSLMHTPGGSSALEGLELLK